MKSKASPSQKPKKGKEGICYLEILRTCVSWRRSVTDHLMTAWEHDTIRVPIVPDLVFFELALVTEVGEKSHPECNRLRELWKAGRVRNVCRYCVDVVLNLRKPWLLPDVLDTVVTNVAERPSI